MPWTKVSFHSLTKVFALELMFIYIYLDSQRPRALRSLPRSWPSIVSRSLRSLVSPRDDAAEKETALGCISAIDSDVSLLLIFPFEQKGLSSCPSC